jgi:hypothetical protein
MEPGAVKTTERGRGEASTPSAPPGSGSLILGRYHPVRPLGSGGSGSVWLVHDEHAGRDIALKVVPSEGKAGARAEREAGAAARLRHPRCLRALALDRDERHVYVAYEHVNGKTLREALRRGELDDRAAIEAAAQVLEALAHAHSKGVVHRDVKPSNVMLEEADDVSIRVLDFGLARVDDADTLTAAGDVPGTLAYIAPERLDGEDASGAADVWSVGVLLWEALAGWHPFSAISPVETARRIGAGAPPLAKSRPDLPRELCETVDRMLALDPRRRPAAKRLPGTLRNALERRARRPRTVSSPRVLREHLVPAMLAGAFAAGAAYVLPFFPRGGAVLLGALAALAALRSPRAGLAVALAVPVLPLGNLSLGLALAYLPLAAAWLLLFARDAANGLLFVAGPLLAPLGALALVPALVQRARGPVRRACQAAAAVLTAAPAVAAGGMYGVAGTERPDDAALAVVGFFGAHPALALEALVFAMAAGGARLACRHGLWGVAAWGSAFLAAAVLLPPATGAGPVDALPLTLGVWAAAVALAGRVMRSRH